MPGTISHESPPSRLLNSDAGSTPHQSSFLPLPGSIDQMLASARPSSFGNAGADFVSLKLFPMSVERSTFMPKNGLQLEAYRRGVPRVSMSVEYTGTPGPNGPRSVKAAPRLRGLGDEHALLGADGENHSIRHRHPPETAGRIVSTSPALSGVSMPLRSRTLSAFTNTFR